MTDNALCPILGLLAVAPYPMAPVDVATVLHEEEGPVRLALRLLLEAKRVRCKKADDGRELYTIEPTFEVGREAIHSVRQVVLRKQTDELERIARTLDREMQRVREHREYAPTPAL